MCRRSSTECGRSASNGLRYPWTDAVGQKRTRVAEDCRELLDIAAGAEGPGLSAVRSARRYGSRRKPATVTTNSSRTPCPRSLTPTIARAGVRSGAKGGDREQRQDEEHEADQAHAPHHPLPPIMSCIMRSSPSPLERV